jgi:urease accessory protein
MKFLSHNWLRAGLISSLGLLAGVAQAHTGHGTNGLFEGLSHPLGLDHLLAMVAVGIWSVAALPAEKTWWGPATFLGFLVLSAVLGTLGVSLPYLEQMIALSVILVGAMLAFTRHSIPVSIGLGLVACAASLHGLAHGAETPESGFAAYALGFFLTTATVHLGGVSAGLALRQHLIGKVRWLYAACGSLFASAGVYLFSQL